MAEMSGIKTRGGARTQVSYCFLALGCFPANLVSDVVCVLFVFRVGSLKG